MNAYLLCVLSILLRGENPQNSAYPPPPPFPISNDCIYVCLVNRNQLLGDAVLVILLVNLRYKKNCLDLYNDFLYLAPLKVLVRVLQPF